MLTVQQLVSLPAYKLFISIWSCCRWLGMIKIAALNAVSRITKSIRILQAHAGAGAPLSSIADVESDSRFLVSGNYLTFYRACGSDVFVDRVLYGRRDYLRTLFGKMPVEIAA